MVRPSLVFSKPLAKHQPTRPRSAKPPKQRARFRLTPRDTQIIQVVYRYRVLTTHQIEALLFQPAGGQDHPTKTSRCRLRLNRLSSAGYLTRTEQPQRYSEGRKPFLYQLATEGAKLLADLQPDSVEPLDWHPRHNQLSPLFLAHQLATNDVRVAIALAAGAPRLSLETWLDDRTLKREHQKDVVTLRGPRGQTVKAAVVPDGYFLLRNRSYPYHCFLEADLGTAAGERSIWGQKDWTRKIRCYLAYYNSGAYTKRYGTHGMRVLTVTTSPKRLANLKRLTEKVGGKSRFWFTTFAQVHPATVLHQPIWYVAGREEPHRLFWDEKKNAA